MSRKPQSTIRKNGKIITRVLYIEIGHGLHRSAAVFTENTTHASEWAKYNLFNVSRNRNKEKNNVDPQDKGLFSQDFRPCEAA